MNYDSVQEFCMHRERVRTPGETEQQTAEKMGCKWRSYQRWMHRKRESEKWASQQVPLPNPRVAPSPAPLRREDVSG